MPASGVVPNRERCHVGASDTKLLLLFRKKSRSARLFTCKRAHDGFPVATNFFQVDPLPPASKVGRVAIQEPRYASRVRGSSFLLWFYARAKMVFGGNINLHRINRISLALIFCKNQRPPHRCSVFSVGDKNILKKP